MTSIDENKRRAAESNPLLYAVVTAFLAGSWAFVVTRSWDWVVLAVMFMTLLNWIWLRPGGRLQRYREKGAKARSNDEQT